MAPTEPSPVEVVQKPSNLMPKSDRGPVFTPLESRSILSLSSIMFFRMFGLFLVLPVFSLLAQDLEDATPLLIGLAFGGYGLTQAVLQIPFGIWSDRIGRKLVIMAGLLLFIIGSLIAAFADNIYVMILARLLQGAGAISSAVFALIADLTRPEVRTRANAGIGASLGMAFGGAFFIAPFLGGFAGLSGIFGLITFMATIGLFILWRFVPEPENPSRTPNTPTLDMVKSVLVLPSIRTIDFGAFVCSTGLSAVFFMIPIKLAEQGWISSELWQIYLPMLLSGGLIMVGASACVHAPCISHAPQCDPIVMSLRICTCMLYMHQARMCTRAHVVHALRMPYNRHLHAIVHVVVRYMSTHAAHAVMMCGCGVHMRAYTRGSVRWRHELVPAV